MAISLGTTSASKLYLGSTEITKAYLGSTQVFGGGAVNNAFELTVETTAANESFLLPMQSVTSIDVDWGDGTVDTGITTDNPTHTYATAGTHSISVTGTAGTVVFNGSGSEGKLRTVTNLGALGWTSFHNSFRDCSSMTSFDFGDCDTSNVTTMRDMFISCSNLTLLNLSNFNTSNVTAMAGMFGNCLSLTSLDVSNFNTSNVTDMRLMFFSCSSLTDIIGVESFNIEALNSTNRLSLFMSGVTLPTSRYDALLVNWEAQNHIDGLSPNFGNSKYTAGSAAATARAALENDHTWSITDGGSV